MNWNDADWYQWVIWLAVAWAAVGGIWRPVGVVLVSAWLALELYYLATTHFLPLWLYLTLDAMILAAIWKWGTTKLDTAIAALFPLAWLGYLSEYMGWLSPYQVWWALFYCMLVQLFLAGPFRQVQDIGSDLVRMMAKGTRDAVGFAKQRF